MPTQNINELIINNNNTLLVLKVHKSTQSNHNLMSQKTKSRQNHI